MNRPFNLCKYLPGALFTEGMQKEKESETTKKPNTRYRDKIDRPPLDSRLIKWLKTEHAGSKHPHVEPIYHILTVAYRKKLSMALPSSIKQPTDITKLLGECDDWHHRWALKLYNLVTRYNKDLKAYKKSNK